MIEHVKLPDSVEELRIWEQQGHPLDYVFFWGHQPRSDGTIGPSCLSQWWPVTFTIEGHVYPSAEHYYMQQKALQFNDIETAARIIQAPNARQAKALGQKVRGYDDPIWARHRFDIAVTGNIAKFGQNLTLRDYLLSTGDKILVEASPEDTIWGIGLAATDERAPRPSTWLGLNLLGFALMRTRATLATGTPSKPDAHS